MKNKTLYIGINANFKFNKKLNPKITILENGIAELYNVDLSQINLGICINIKNKNYFVCEKINKMKFKLIDINLKFPEKDNSINIDNIFFPYTNIESARLSIELILKKTTNTYIVLYNSNIEKPVIYTLENLLNNKTLISINNNKDRCALILKRGDKITAKNKEHLGLKHGDPIQIIDEKDFPGYNLDEIVASNLMHEAFTIIEFDKSKKKLFESFLLPIENDNKNLYRPRKKRLIHNTLNAITNIPNLSQLSLTGEKIPILNGTDLSEDNFIDASIINNEKNFDDIKATTEGNISVGATGDFSTFALAFSDLGNLTNNLNLKQISNITETTLAQGTEVLGGFNLNIYSQSEHIGNYNKGYLIQINHNADFLDNRFDGPGNLNIYKLKIIRTTTSDVSSRALILNSNNTIAFNLSVYNCIMNGNNLSGTGIRCASNIPILFIYENLIFDNTDGIMIDGTDGNASSIYENNSIYSNTSGFDLSNNDGTCINNISMDNTTDFLNIGSATGNNNADSDGTGTNLNWNSGSNNLINKVPGTEFESTTFSDDDFLIPKTTSDLIGAGLSPTISNNLRYINEIFIDTSDVIIGAKGRSKGNYFNQRYW